MEEPKIESEQELQVKINAAKKLRSEQCHSKIDIILKEFNCVISTNAVVLIDGQPIVPIIQAL